MKIATLEIKRIWTRDIAGPEDIVGPEGSLDEPYPPIIVAEDGEGGFELVDGHHRLAAARVEGRRRIRAIVVSPEELQRLESMSEDAWIEWVQAQAEEM